MELKKFDYATQFGGSMTLQQLKYMIIVAERGSITEAAKELYLNP